MALDTQQKRMSAMTHGRVWLRQAYPSSLDAVQRASIGLAYGGNSLSVGPTWTSSSEPRWWPIESFPLPTGAYYVFEVWMKASTGTARARLYDQTGAAAVAGSEIATTSSTYVWVRSGAITLTKGSDYAMQGGTIGGDVGLSPGGRIVLV